MPSPAPVFVWSPELVTAVFTGIALIITAIGGIAVQLFIAHRSSKKLDTVIKLTNGGKSELLSEISTVKSLLADETGRKADRTRADAAVGNLERHENVIQTIPELKK